MNHTNIPKLSLAALLAGFVLVPSSLHAAPVTVENYSFEADGLGTQATDPTGWVRTGAGGYQSFNPTQTPQPSDGASHGWTNGSGAGGPSSLSQIVPAEFIADGATYTLTVDIGQLGPNFTGSEGAIRLIGGAAGAGTPLSNANGTAELAGIAPGSGTPYQTVSVSYTALPAGDPFAGQLIGIELVGTEGTQVLWDNVRLDASSTGEDTTPPTVSRFVPEVGSTGNAASADLEITFIELVRKEAGNITIKESDGDAVVETIDIASGNVTISDSDVMINPSNALAAGTGYYVQIASGAIKDFADNDFAGISDKATWNFTTATPLPGGAIAVANGSFETAGSNPEWVPGWTASSSAFRTRTSAPGNVNPTNGGRQAWMNNGTHGYQDTGEPIVAGKTYTLTVDLGADQDNFLDIETVIIRLYGSDLGTGTALAEITPEGPSASGW
ncbi:MAG: Ig-like domain-containing protein, partial [Akkermansiaceae bacterium]|nr:Ig-like domain-containing protein [Akkermansiaceae bacterium]